MNPLWTLVPPLLVIPFILLFGERRRNLREGAIVIAGLWLLAINDRIYSAVKSGEIVESGELHLLADYSLRLSAEPMGVMFGLLASFLWVVTTVYSVGYMRGHNEQNQTRFYCCFALAIAGVMAAAYADNLLTLFVAYEAITISTFPLVTHAGNDESKKAGRLYLLLLMCGSIGLFLPAVIWIATVAGTLDFRPGGVLSDAGLSHGAIAVMLGLIVFGVGKAAVMPMHRWLPAAMVAPTPVSALLHAVAVVKTGVFTILKIITYTFGIDMVSASGAASWLLPIVAFTVIASSIIAFTKDNLKARLAYSTISSLSYIVLAALLASTMSVTGGALHIVMHAFSKITLFFCAGAIMVALHKKQISQLNGIGRQMPITMIAFFIGALGIIGIPPGPGMWSKLLIAGGSLDAGNAIWVGVLMLSTLLNIGYLLDIPLRAFFKAPEKPIEGGWQEAPFPSLWAITVTATTCVLLFLFPQPLIDLLGLIQWR
jgi:multicomponent Na+:H+ antiporter subunit D